MVISNVDLRNKGPEVEKAALKARRKQAEREAGPEGGGMAAMMIKDDHYKDIPPRYELTTEPLPFWAGDMAAAAAAAGSEDNLGSGEVANISKVAEKMGDNNQTWHGDAANTFDTYYLEPFDNCVLNQKQVIKALERSMLTYEKALEGRRKDVIQIADQTIKALDSLGSTSGEASLGFTILGATLAVVGTAVSGGTLAIALAIGAGAATTLSATVSAASEISGSTADSIVKSMYDLLDDLDDDVNAKAKELAGDLNDAKSKVSSQLGKDKGGDKVPALLPHEPDTSSAVTSGKVDKGDFIPPKE